MRVQVQFRGRVQGVGFRATARSIAQRHAVSGWARNEPDGSVRLEAQGSEDAVNAFLEALAQMMSRNIESTSRTPLADTPLERGFRVR